MQWNFPRRFFRKLQFNSGGWLRKYTDVSKSILNNISNLNEWQIKLFVESSFYESRGFCAWLFYSPERLSFLRTAWMVTEGFYTVRMRREEGGEGGGGGGGGGRRGVITRVSTWW